jgi:hypothetical protein
MVSATTRSNTDKMVVVAKWAIGVSVVIILFVSLAASGSGKASAPVDPTGTMRVVLWDLAQKQVTALLKAPSTADFGVQTSFDTTRYLGNDYYECAGWVDAQNSFGANIRTNFKMVVYMSEKNGMYPYSFWMG